METKETFQVWLTQTSHIERHQHVRKVEKECITSVNIEKQTI